MIHSKTYTEEELYVYDIDQPENDIKCNICEKEFSSFPNKQKKKTPAYSRRSKPLQCEYCHKIFMTMFNLKRDNLTYKIILIPCMTTQ